MKKVIRLSEQELKTILHNSVARALQEGHNINQIKIAQKELYSFHSNLSSIGLRLEGTKFEGLFRKMADAIVKLNKALIQEIRKEGV